MPSHTDCPRTGEIDGVYVYFLISLFPQYVPAGRVYHSSMRSMSSGKEPEHTELGIFSLACLNAKHDPRAGDETSDLLFPLMGGNPNPSHHLPAR